LKNSLQFFAGSFLCSISIDTADSDLFLEFGFGNIVISPHLINKSKSDNSWTIIDGFSFIALIVFPTVLSTLFTTSKVADETA